MIKNFDKLLQSDAIKEVCAVIRSLCLDDDIRIQVSKAHEHARFLAVDLLCELTSLTESEYHSHVITPMFFKILFFRNSRQYIIYIKEIFPNCLPTNITKISLLFE